MRYPNLLWLICLSVMALGAGDGGCFGSSGQNPSGPSTDAGPPNGDRLRVLAAEPRGPFAPGATVQLSASAGGGAPPYVFEWQPPARTVDPAEGLGEVVTGSVALTVRVVVTDDRGERAADVITLEVESPRHAHVEIEIEGPGTVTAGDLVCNQACGLETELGRTETLTARPIDDARFVGWSGCADSSAQTIQIAITASRTICVARFDTGPTALPCDRSPAAPHAEIFVHPRGDLVPFERDDEGAYLVPPSTRIVVDGTRSRTFAVGGLTYRWSLSYDPFGEVPSASVGWLRVTTPGFSGTLVDARLEVEDSCGQVETATASYVTR